MLEHTRVTGRLAKLHSMTQLVHLHLGHTNVQGNLRHISKMSELIILGLGQTHVTGNLQQLNGLRWLKFLWIDDTGIQGNITDLHPKDWLAQLTISHTNITVSMSDLAAFFPRLRIVDVAHTTSMQNQSVSELQHFVTESTPLERLVLTGCGLTGQLPASLPRSLGRLELQNNTLYAGLSEFKLDLRNTSLVLLDLSGNGIQAQLLSVEVAANSTVIINLESNSIPCTLPDSLFGKNVVALYDPCLTSWTSIIRVLVVGGALMAVAGALFKARERGKVCFRRRNPAVAPGEQQEEAAGEVQHAAASASNGTKPKTRTLISWIKIVAPFVIWVSNLFDFSTDIMMNLQGISSGTIASANSYCHDLTTDAQLYRSIGHEDYSGFLAISELGSNADFAAYYDAVISVTGTTLANERVESPFAKMCVKAECEYSSEDRTCRSPASATERQGQREFYGVLFMLSTVLITGKELFKAVVVLYYVLRRDIPIATHWRYFGKQSLLWPLFVVRGRQEVIDLSLVKETRFDLLWQLLYDGILENLLQLVLGVTYSNNVAGIGLDSIAQWSVAFSIAGLLKLALHAGYNVLTVRAVAQLRNRASALRHRATALGHRASALGHRASALLHHTTGQGQTPAQPTAAVATSNASKA